MKKLLLLLFLGWVSLLSGYERTLSHYEYSFELRGAKWYLGAGRAQEMFRKRPHAYDILVAHRVSPTWDVYVNAGYMSRKKEHKAAYLYPLAAGLRYYIPIMGRLEFFLGAGLQGGYIRSHDHSRHGGHKKYTRHGWGFVGNSGLRCQLTKCVFIDLFADYQYMHFNLQKARHHKRGKVDVRGPKVGLGIGITM